MGNMMRQPPGYGLRLNGEKCEVLVMNRRRLRKFRSEQRCHTSKWRGTWDYMAQAGVPLEALRVFSGPGNTLVGGGDPLEALVRARGGAIDEAAARSLRDLPPSRTSATCDDDLVDERMGL